MRFFIGESIVLAAGSLKGIQIAELFSEKAEKRIFKGVKAAVGTGKGLADNNLFLGMRTGYEILIPPVRCVSRYICGVWK